MRNIKDAFLHKKYFLKALLSTATHKEGTAHQRMYSTKYVRESKILTSSFWNLKSLNLLKSQLQFIQKFDNMYNFNHSCIWSDFISYYVNTHYNIQIWKLKFLFHQADKLQLTKLITYCILQCCHYYTEFMLHQNHIQYSVKYFVNCLL